MHHIAENPKTLEPITIYSEDPRPSRSRTAYSHSAEVSLSFCAVIRAKISSEKVVPASEDPADTQKMIRYEIKQIKVHGAGQGLSHDGLMEGWGFVLWKDEPSETQAMDSGILRTVLKWNHMSWYEQDPWEPSDCSG